MSKVIIKEVTKPKFEPRVFNIQIELNSYNDVQDFRRIGTYDTLDVDLVDSDGDILGSNSEANANSVFDKVINALQNISKQL